MSRSIKKHFKGTLCCVSLKTWRKWKKDCSQLRRHRQKQALRNSKVLTLEDAEDDETFYPEKFQHDMKDTNDWSGPHDGFVRFYDPKKQAKTDWEGKPWHLTRK